MFTAFIFDNDNSSVRLLTESLNRTSFKIHLKGIASSIKHCILLHKNIDFVFCNITLLPDIGLLKNQLLPTPELICIGNTKEDAFNALQLNITNFLLKPFKEKDIDRVLNDLQKKNKQVTNVLQKATTAGLIGIPTIDGMEYLMIKDIIQCEGLQKCTRVITTSRTNIVSSYSIGKFAEKLTPFGFYATHKSFLINLSHVQQYKKEGLIILTNNHKVPLARRRKCDFLSQILHL